MLVGLFVVVGCSSAAPATISPPGDSPLAGASPVAKACPTAADTGWATPAPGATPQPAIYQANLAAIAADFNSAAMVGWAHLSDTTGSLEARLTGATELVFAERHFQQCVTEAAFPAAVADEAAAAVSASAAVADALASLASAATVTELEAASGELAVPYSAATEAAHALDRALLRSACNCEVDVSLPPIIGAGSIVDPPGELTVADSHAWGLRGAPNGGAEATYTIAVANPWDEFAVGVDVGIWFEPPNGPFGPTRTVFVPSIGPGSFGQIRERTEAARFELDSFRRISGAVLGVRSWHALIEPAVLGR